MLSDVFNRKIRFNNKSGYLFPKWTKTSISTIFDERCERGCGDEDLLAVTINSGVIKRNDIELKDNSSDDKSNYKCVCVDDIAYNTMRMWQGASGVSPYNGIVSPAYTVIYLRTQNTGDIRFWGYYFKTHELICEFQRFSQGLTSDTWNLKYPQLADIQVWLPCTEEQKAIADFLDTVENIIAKCEQHYENILKIKKALLNKMFI